MPPAFNVPVLETVRESGIMGSGDIINSPIESRHPAEVSSAFMCDLERIGKMKNPKDNRELMQAVNSYLSVNGLILPQNAEFQYCIDGVLVFVDNKIALSITDRPDLTGYPITETEHTDRYLRQQVPIAV